MFNEYLTQIKSGQTLGRQASSDLLGLVLDEDDISEAQVANFLTSMTKKHPEVEEILGFVDAMRARMTKLNLSVDAVDTCGTGGDKSGSFNISTASSIVVAASGVPVAKHGNRSASSKCGSADVLETLNIPIDLNPDNAANSIENKNFAFLFAQQYHPSLKKLAIVRKQLGFPTVFNLLGPLLNPAGSRRQVIGTFSNQNAELIAEVVKRLDIEHVIVLNSKDNLDEASLSAPTTIREIRGDKISIYEIKPEDFNLPPATKAELAGGDATENANILIAALTPDKELTAHQRVVVLNASIALVAAGSADNISDGIRLATEVIVSGKAKSKLEELQQ